MQGTSALLKTPESTSKTPKSETLYIPPTKYILVFLKSERRVPLKFSLRFSSIFSPSPIDMSRRDGKAPIDEAEQQRLREKAYARRIEARRIEIEQKPNPLEVLQYSSPLDNIPWTPFGLNGDPVVSQDDLWRVLGRDVEINYDDMHRIMNKDREESISDDNVGGGGGGGDEEDIVVPEILIKLQRGRSSSFGTGQLVNVRGKFDIN